MKLHNFWLTVTFWERVPCWLNCQNNEFCRCIECRYNEGWHIFAWCNRWARTASKVFTIASNEKPDQPALCIAWSEPSVAHRISDFEPGKPRADPEGLYVIQADHNMYCTVLCIQHYLVRWLLLVLLLLPISYQISFVFKYLPYN